MYVDLDEATRAVLGMLGSFGDVMREGSIDERRRVIRAFVRQIRLDPQNHEGRAEVFALPDFTAVTRYQATAPESSFQVVAGAPVVVEKKRPGFVVDFTWRIDAARAKRPCPRVFDADPPARFPPPLPPLRLPPFLEHASCGRAVDPQAAWLQDRGFESRSAREDRRFEAGWMKPKPRPRHGSPAPFAECSSLHHSRARRYPGLWPVWQPHIRPARPHWPTLGPGPSPYDTLIRDSLPVDWRSLRTRMELSSLLRSHRTLGPHNDLRVATRCDGVCEPMHQWGWSRQTRDGEGGRKRTSHRSDASRPLGEAPGTLGGVVIQ